MQRLEATIFGKVQGIGFRFFVEAQAILRGLKGYAKNLPDGAVEVIAEGEKEKLEGLLKELKKGPRWSRVEKVAANYSKATNEFKGFSIK